MSQFSKVKSLYNKKLLTFKKVFHIYIFPPPPHPPNVKLLATTAADGGEAGANAGLASSADELCEAGHAEYLCRASVSFGGRLSLWLDFLPVAGRVR